MPLTPDPDRKLTVLDPQFERQRAMTWPGQAHFAGTGPHGKTCRQCEYWSGCGVESGYHPQFGKFRGELKKRPCERHAALMNKVGPGVPHDAPACKHFVENTSPPAIVKRSF